MSSSVDKAFETQLKNIEARTGKSLAEIGKMVDDSGLTRHGQVRDYLIQQLGMGYGDATQFVHYWFKTDGASIAREKGLSTSGVLDEIYSGSKASLRPIHDKVMEIINAFGEHEVAPKKGYVSLRRKHQFAMVGPAPRNTVEIGLNVKDLPASARLKEQPPGSMCSYTLRLSRVEEVDDELAGWLRQAYERSG